MSADRQRPARMAPGGDPAGMNDDARSGCGSSLTVASLLSFAVRWFVTIAIRRGKPPALDGGC